MHLGLAQTPPNYHHMTITTKIGLTLTNKLKSVMAPNGVLEAHIKTTPIKYTLKNVYSLKQVRKRKAINERTAVFVSPFISNFLSEDEP